MHHANLERRDEKTQILKTALKIICNDIAMIDLDPKSYPTTHSMTDIGSTIASHIMDGGCFDKAIRAHLFIDAAIYQHIIKLAFNEEEHCDMRAFMEKVDSIVAVFDERFEETFKRLTEGGIKNACTLGAVPPHNRCDQSLHQNRATCRPQRTSVLRNKSYFEYNNATL